MKLQEGELTGLDLASKEKRSPYFKKISPTYLLTSAGLLAFISRRLEVLGQDGGETDKLFLWEITRVEAPELTDLKLKTEKSGD